MTGNRCALCKGHDLVRLHYSQCIGTRLLAAETFLYIFVDYVDKQLQYSHLYMRTRGVCVISMTRILCA